MFKKIGAWVMGAALVFTAGCQPLGGLDMNQAIENEWKTDTYEASLSMGLQYGVGDTSALSKSDKEGLPLWNGFQLNVSSLKVNRKEQTMSAKGSLSAAKLNLPFAVSLDKNGAVLNVEGANKPIVIADWRTNELTGLSHELTMYDDYWFYSLKRLMKELHWADQQEVTKKAIGLLAKNLPNATSFAVDKKTETIQGQTVSGHQLRFDMSDKEFASLFRSMFKNMALDDQGLRELAVVIYDKFHPELKELGFVEELFEDRQLGTEAVYTGAKAIALYLSSEAGRTWERELLSPIKLKAEAFVDESKHIRRWNAEIAVQSPEGLEDEIRGGKLTVRMDRWNINGDVKPDIISTKDAIPYEDLSNEDNLRQAVQPDSAFYKLLKEQLRITEKYLYFYIWPESDLDGASGAEAGGTEAYLAYDYTAYISSNNTAYVQGRELGEGLGYKVVWDAGTKTMTIASSQTEIVLKAGSATARVNGTDKSMGEPAAMKHGALYVPVRFVAEQLGAKVKTEGEESVYSIEIYKP
ncbi:copper amine oxidase N-terminal domain-containing protein [Paenibacillus sp. MZ04-78.2]|uniref:copper amine oxidase N-terminal domain-containing protein n=1 Tax=Paenibacillus sp. MZ04-78.2 TaxID=2962034 RepID=UPI0020B65818|nr:copper amine oxidase N-terminal domain-containing protein [Paenibacillus sp. MZ04-78.2]MCP3775113.1 copper amine oxidase N-terminal domain-containing protein [Paenibacillus sp. MZ04-78.2]